MELSTEKSEAMLRRIIDHYGHDAQKVKAIEELSELIKELSKDLIGKGKLSNIAEEFADVKVMLGQLQIIYGFENDLIEAIQVEKILRTLERSDLEKESVSSDMKKGD